MGMFPAAFIDNTEVVIDQQSTIINPEGLRVRYFTAEAPQYDLPDLRGKQRTQSCLVFCFPLIPLKKAGLAGQRKTKRDSPPMF